VVGGWKASLEGLQTLRAYNAESRCVHNISLHNDIIRASSFTGIGVFAWMNFWSNMIAALFMSATILTCVFLAECK